MVEMRECRGADSDLRRWGLKLAQRGGKSGKKRAVIATDSRKSVSSKMVCIR